MSITSSFDFGSSSSFSLSQAIIQGSEGSLDHEDTLLTWDEDFADDTDFSYDNAKAEFVGGLVRAKDLRVSSSVLGATYTSSKNLSWSQSGSLSATDVGTPALNSGKLECIGGGNNAVRYENSDIGAPGNVGAMRVKYTPNYSGTPATNCNIFEFAPLAGNNDRMVVFHSSTGTVRLTAYTSIGTIKHSAVAFSASPWSPSAGVEYEFELDWDTVAGAVRLFINGILLGSMPVSSYARGTDAVRMYIGAGAVYPVADASFDDVLLFSTVQHTSNYTPGYSVIESIYATSKIDLPTHTHTVPGQDISALIALAVVATGSPRYIIEGKYWNGLSWATSNGSYSQANSLEDVNTNLSSLGLTTGDNTIDASVVFPDSNTLASIDNLAIQHMAGTHYESGSIETGSALSIQSIESFSASVSETLSTTIRFQLRIDGSLKYHNGSAWVSSDGTVTQGNTAAQINSNIGTLALGANSSIKVRIAMETSDITVSPSIDSMTIIYDFGGILDTPETCIVWGYYLDIAGNPVADASVTFQLKRSNKKEYKEANSNIVEKKVTVTTDLNGYFETPLIRSSEFEGGGTYILSIEKSSDTLNTSKSGSDTALEFTVPDAIDKNITDLLTAA